MKQTNNNMDGNWGKVLSGFLGGFVRQWSDGIVSKIKEQIRAVVYQAQKSLIGTIILLLGVGFFLVGISLLVNELIRRPGSWIGFASVGMFTVVVGYFIQRK